MKEIRPEIVERGAVSRIKTGLFRYQAWPTVCRDENGVLYTVCSGHRIGHLCPWGKNVLYRSFDEGKTWSSPMIINDTELDDRDGGILALGGGRMLMTWFNHAREFYFIDANRNWIERNTNSRTHDMTMGLLEDWKHLSDEQNRHGSFIRISNDSGYTWGEKIQVPVSSPHGPIALKGGRLLYVGKEFHSDLPYTGEILACVSHDGGESWELLSRIATPEGCTVKNVHEPYATELEDGRIMVSIRAQGEEVAHKFTVYTCFSEDGGRSWSEPKSLGISGSPPHTLLHSSGALVLTYGRRENPFGIRAIVSLDGGATFGEEILLTDAAHGDLGYPSTVELSDGSLYTVYYQKFPEDGVCHIMYTKWRL